VLSSKWCAVDRAGGRKPDRVQLADRDVLIGAAARSRRRSRGVPIAQLGKFSRPRQNRPGPGRHLDISRTRPDRQLWTWRAPGRPAGSAGQRVRVKVSVESTSDMQIPHAPWFAPSHGRQGRVLSRLCRDSRESASVLPCGACVIGRVRSWFWLRAALLGFIAVLTANGGARAEGGRDGTEPSTLLVKARCDVFDKARQECLLWGPSLLELITRPELYDGRRVHLVGWVNFAFEGNALYLSRGDWENGLTRSAVWIAPRRGSRATGTSAGRAKSKVRGR
jgi:hypothetical protein